LVKADLERACPEDSGIAPNQPHRPVARLTLVAFSAPHLVTEVSSSGDGSDQYLVRMRGAWQGEVVQMLAKLRTWQDKRGEPPEGAPESDPGKILQKTIINLENNRERMRYPEYRQAGLPVTTAWMESLVKEMNDRVKGTEMFWNGPAGEEAILQVRAAALCDDERLAKHLRTRPGCPFTRRPKSPNGTTENIKS
jgi:hypothetical protein